MDRLSMSRRTMLATAAAIGTTAAIPTTASALKPMSEIERHWRDRCDAYREFEADPHTLEDQEYDARYWERIDAAEAAILNSPDVGPRAIEMRLWVAWSHARPTRTVDQGEVRTVMCRRDDLDCHEKMLLGAILALRGETWS